MSGNPNGLYRGKNFHRVTRGLRVWCDTDGNVVGWAGHPHVPGAAFEDLIGGERTYCFDATEAQIDNANFVHRPGQLARLIDKTTGRCIAVEENPADHPDAEDYVLPENR